ncbi:hypothetical protein D1818_08105 [Aquimarina sp. BL5]|uniref:hypothetical protein n=1 Tax=Aquimarina sp. BL5 TaxID=1714860 RepID=UPI000E4DCA39|nr:hypothetical protein [Aquimarina sp. BL5]AXT50794.1 hypothetical protein D1818_08105 [Aquimarina sp. BL5]RKN04483.1 hypothetical protein D7036_12265 [Aquimarina sp. BL5]
MKKITLLLVAAVFAIGIQSCSTDEIGIEEEALQENPEMKFNNMIEGPTSYCDLFVMYPSTMSSYDRDVFRFQHINTTESFGNFTYVTTECSDIEIWNVDCSKIPTQYNGNSVEGSTAVYQGKNPEDSAVDDDDNSPIDSSNPSNYIYLEGNIMDCNTILQLINHQ